MTAGLNTRIQIWRMKEMTDDYVGGASISGTVVHQNLMCRMQEQEEEQMFLQQGLETTKIFRFVVKPGGRDIRERDEAEITEPFDHVFYGDRFRIVSVRHADHNPRDPRNYTILLANRSVRAHDQQ